MLYGFFFGVMNATPPNCIKSRPKKINQKHAYMIKNQIKFTRIMNEEKWMRCVMLDDGKMM